MDGERRGPSRGPLGSESHSTSEHLRAAHMPEMTPNHPDFLLRAQYRPLPKACKSTLSSKRSVG